MSSADWLQSQQCAVTGPLIVLRVRSARSEDGRRVSGNPGRQVVDVLTRYLAYTQTEDTKWQRPSSQQSPHLWQLFEIIGDFGSDGQTKVMDKLSGVAKHRHAALIRAHLVCMLQALQWVLMGQLAYMLHSEVCTLSSSLSWVAL